MEWLIGIVAYFGLVWLFLKFFAFVKQCDEDIEQIKKQKHI